MSAAIVRTKKAKAPIHAETILGFCTAIRPMLDDLVDYGRHNQVEDMEAELVQVLTALRNIELMAAEMTEEGQ